MSTPTERKIAMIGAGGVRTPLVLFGINEAAATLGAKEVTLYDPDEDRVKIMAALGRAIVAKEGGDLKIRETTSVEDAVDGADFVLHSIRVGGIASRAANELAAIKHGFPGQETTGPAGAAMALRTAPIAVEYAKIVARLSPKAWFVNFTNPAGLITQAVAQNTDAKVVGICDTPTELLHRIAVALGAHYGELHCEYVGLNHLGWVRKIVLKGEDITDKVLADDDLLRQFYSAPLFDFDMIRQLRLIPTEYLFFYYSKRRALENQKATGSSRGTEVEAMNVALIDTLAQQLSGGDGAAAIQTYVDYLNRRSGSYMKLEAQAGSAFDKDAPFDEDPFRVASGYHRIAIDVMNALCGDTPQRIIVNTRNNGVVSDIAPGDIVETPCLIANDTITPEPVGALPEDVRGLVLSIKAYERAAITAALTPQANPLARLTARKAFLLHPAINDWEASDPLLRDLLDPTCLHC